MQSGSSELEPCFHRKTSKPVSINLVLDQINRHKLINKAELLFHSMDVQGYFFTFSVSVISNRCYNYCCFSMLYL